MLKRNIVLGYHDSLLRCSDVELLEENQWLNDNLIGFIYEYYEYDKYKEHMEEFLFVNPSMVQIIKFSEGNDLLGFIGSWFEKALVCIPVNNNNEQLQPGGTHWSLLVMYPREASCQHFDSAAHCNHNTALTLAQHIGHAFKAATGKTLEFKEASTTQQSNAYDCGIHVISNTEMVCEDYARKSSQSFQNEVMASCQPSEKRKQMKDLIYKLSKEQPAPP